MVVELLEGESMNPEDVKIGMKVLYLEEVWEILKWPHYVSMRDTPYGVLGDDNYR